MRILRQASAFFLVFLLAFPVFSKTDAIGQMVYSQAATVRDAALTPGSTLLSGDTVAVGANGVARIAVTGGGQIEVLDQSAARFARDHSAVQLFLESGRATFRGAPESPVEAVIADATIRPVHGTTAVGLININDPNSAMVVATMGALEITTRHDDHTVLLQEGSAAKITLLPDPQDQNNQNNKKKPVAAAAGKATGLTEGKIALIAILVGGGTVITAIILATTEKKIPPPTLANEVSPFKLP